MDTMPSATSKFPCNHCPADTAEPTRASLTNSWASSAARRSPRTSPVEARNSVATGCCATDSLRHGGVPVDVPDVAPDIAEFFVSTN